MSCLRSLLPPHFGQEGFSSAPNRRISLIAPQSPQRYSKIGITHPDQIDSRFSLLRFLSLCQPIPLPQAQIDRRCPTHRAFIHHLNSLEMAIRGQAPVTLEDVALNPDHPLSRRAGQWLALHRKSHGST